MRNVSPLNKPAQRRQPARPAPPDRPRFSPPSTENRTRVGTGAALFLEGVDGRSVIARRFRELLAQLVTDIGGDPSEAQIQIARRASALSVWAESCEAQLAAGREMDIARIYDCSEQLAPFVRELRHPATSARNCAFAR